MLLSVIFILADGKEDVRGKRMAWYTVLVLILVIWNPVVASHATLFFGEDMRAYLRIFYLLPLMPLIAYAGTKVYEKAARNHKLTKKILTVLVLCITIISCGGIYDSSMYREATNIYKIDQDAYEISNILMDNSDGGRPVAWVPKTEDIWYGIRQYEGQIMLEGDSNTLTTWAELFQAMNENEFNFVVFSKEDAMNDRIRDTYLQEIGQTENYRIYKKTAY
jgi:uncharacterized membrane protein